MWQLQMHCNLKPPDAAPVVIRFNHNTRSEVEVGPLIAAL